MQPTKLCTSYPYSAHNTVEYERVQGIYKDKIQLLRERRECINHDMALLTKESQRLTQQRIQYLMDVRQTVASL